MICSFTSIAARSALRCSICRWYLNCLAGGATRYPALPPRLGCGYFFFFGGCRTVLRLPKPLPLPSCRGVPPHAPGVLALPVFLDTPIVQPPILQSATSAPATSALFPLTHPLATACSLTPIVNLNTTPAPATCEGTAQPSAGLSAYGIQPPPNRRRENQSQTQPSVKLRIFS